MCIVYSSTLLLFQTKPKLDTLEFPINFERFLKPKTIDNVVGWLNDSNSSAKIRDADVNQMSANGASNAIGSIAELEAQTRVNRPNDINLRICVAHQNNRAGGYASGIHDHAEPVNEELGVILKKSHGIQVRLSRAPNRMEVYAGIQKKNNRQPMLKPKPGNDTRWDATVDEVHRANIIMSDVAATLDVLLAPDGDDYNLHNDEEKSNGNTERLSYDERDVMVLRQYEASAMEAKYFSKFTQERGNSYSSMLLEIKIALQNCSGDYFTMHSGKFSIFIFDT
jgi:hypothetical protein